MTQLKTRSAAVAARIVANRPLQSIDPVILAEVVGIIIEYAIKVWQECHPAGTKPSVSHAGPFARRLLRHEARKTLEEHGLDTALTTDVVHEALDEAESMKVEELERLVEELS